MEFPDCLCWASRRPRPAPKGTPWTPFPLRWLLRFAPFPLTGKEYVWRDRANGLALYKGHRRFDSQTTRNQVRKRVYISVALGLAVAALAVPVYPSEPAYQGKSLSDWIVAMNTAHEPEDKQEARGTVLHLASNSTPPLRQVRSENRHRRRRGEG